MTTAKKEHFQTEIATVTTKAAAMPTKIATGIDVTIIVIKEAKEVTVAMTGEEELFVVLAIKASHITWRESIVDLAPNPRVAAKVTVDLQVTAVLVLTRIQMRAREIMTITILMSPIWLLMKERYLHPVATIQPSNVVFRDSKVKA
eukprot:12947549-Ditylum_brightwellii.AAC.1